MARRFTLRDRASGVLLHPTSLPGRHGVGDIGPEARRFAEFLACAGQRWWQMLPVAPPAACRSPYTAVSAFAGNPLLLSLELLAQDGWLGPDDLEPAADLRAERVDYAAAERFKSARFEKAFAAFEAGADGEERSRFDAYRAAEASWLQDHALFSAVKERHGGAVWTDWERGLRSREPGALAQAAKTLAARVRYHRFLQYQFDRQWAALRERCSRLGVGLLGDVPIYVAHDSAEVWAQPDLFHLGPDGRPTAVAGVPPDCFSETGQLWGNPLYRWEVHRERGFAWWIDRVREAFRRFDAVRLDHFLAFQRYWEVPGEAKTARHGRWVPGPGAGFFDKLFEALGPLEIVAEDLGAVTEEVHALRERCGLPGMRILQFAFSGDPRLNANLPHRYSRRCVVYTGTHDNDTSRGWYAKAPGAERDFARRYLGSDRRAFHWQLLRAAWMSAADLAIAPAQDLLGLGAEARMNLPGTVEGNWLWRLKPGALDGKLRRRLADLTQTYGRAPGLGGERP